MARTPEQILREITADNIFRIAQLMAENESLKENVDELNKKMEEILLKLAVEKKE